MSWLIAFWAILRKDVMTYYLKPPNVSWGILLPLAWTLMFFVKSDTPVDLRNLLPGVTAMSVLFGTTSLLAVTVTFEKKQRSFERLLLAPLPLNLLLLAKTAGAIVFGLLNSLVPLCIASAFADLSGTAWGVFATGALLTSFSSTFLGMFVAVSVSEVFEAQTFSNFIRFPMVFLCGLFVPIAQLPMALQPLSYLLPLTYGTDILHAGLAGAGRMPLWLDYSALTALCIALFLATLANIRRRWIL
jgi:ABC-2 type transport system permease protein